MLDLPDLSEESLWQPWIEGEKEKGEEGRGPWKTVAVCVRIKPSHALCYEGRARPMCVRGDPHPACNVKALPNKRLPSSS